jgi:hypothetical protein
VERQEANRSKRSEVRTVLKLFSSAAAPPATVASSRKRSIIAAVVAAASAALAVFAASAQGADGVTVSRFEIPGFSFFNPCTNENVTIVGGTALSVIDTTQDNHGLEGHSVDIALKGVGETTGAQYTWVGTNTITENTSDNGATAETVVTYSRLVTPGQENDLLFAIVFHETFNANGDLVVRFNRLIPGACV